MPSRTQITVAATGSILALLAFAGCSPDTSANAGNAGATGESSQEAPAPEPVAEPADLTGEWTQQNSGSADSFQQATITADTIEVYWVSDGGSTKALYWAGSYVAPTDAGDYAWESTNNTEMTGSAMLASDAATKTFTLTGATISYDVTALGVTKTVELTQP